MIRLKFMATVTIDGEISEENPNLLPIGQIAENWNGLDAALTKMIEEELGDGLCVKVKKQFSYVSQMGEQHGTEKA